MGLESTGVIPTAGIYTTGRVREAIDSVHGLPALHVAWAGGIWIIVWYLTSKLDSATTIVSTGASLLHVKSLVNVARMLQPAMLVLEDVDLVYSSRDTNPYGAALGELMDELDGFARDDEIIFVRQVIKGAAGRSYGIQVARLAGLPTTVIDRAKTILERLEADDSSHNLLRKRMKKEKVGTDTSKEDDQLALF